MFKKITVATFIVITSFLSLGAFEVQGKLIDNQALGPILGYDEGCHSCSPQNVPGPTGPTGPAGVASAIGFSGSLNDFTLSSGDPTFEEPIQLSGFSTADPFYPGLGFDGTNFIVPVTGRYAVKITINYELTAGVGTVTASSPAFVLQRVSAPATNLLAGSIPKTLNTTGGITLSPAGEVVLTGDVFLRAGDVIGLFFQPDGLSSAFEFNLTADPFTPGVVWSMHTIN
ncbi:MAG: hypothetical protein H0X46_07275 [Bacteroidetes bacterium]|nr:hypothetical protein [Bacteroidota bacterium]